MDLRRAMGHPMLVEAALLCEAATTREGLLSVLGGGLTQFWGIDYPLPLRAMLAVMLLCESDDFGLEHSFVATLTTTELGEPVACCEGKFVGLPAIEDASDANVPLTVDLSQFQLPSPGDYEVHVHIDDELLAVFPIHSGVGG